MRAFIVSIISALLLSMSSLSVALAEGDGRAAFATHCAACHGVDGAGVEGLAPRLIDVAEEFSTTPEGRLYLANVLAYGLAGTIDTGGVVFNGYMPNFDYIALEDRVAILNYLKSVSEKSTAAAFTIDEVATAISAPKNLEEVHGLRPKKKTD